MWKTIVFFLPNWQVFIQAFITFCIPYLIARLFIYIRERTYQNDDKQESKTLHELAGNYTGVLTLDIDFIWKKLVITLMYTFESLT